MNGPIRQLMFRLAEYFDRLPGDHEEARTAAQVLACQFFLSVPGDPDRLRSLIADPARDLARVVEV